MNPADLPSPEPQSVSAPPSRDTRWIFLGPHGLRAGWSIAVFLGLVVTLLIFFLPLVQLVLRHRPHANSAMPPSAGLLIEFVQFLPVLIATFILSRIERKPLLAYGYQGRARAIRFLSGLAWGFIAISALVFALWKSGHLAFEPRALFGAPLLKDACLWGIMFLLTGFFEESLFRGFIQFTLTRGIGFWWGALLVSALFAVTHTANPGESRVGIVSVVGVGLVFCLSLWYTGSLWWAVGFHAAWDWGQSFFYGTADSGLVVQGHLFTTHPIGSILWSGGTTGPEGSIFIVPLLVILAAAIFLWWGRRVRSPFAGAAWRPQPPFGPAPDPLPPSLEKFTLSE